MTDQANLLVELDLENDGRWIAEVPAIAGALAYGATKDEAERNVRALVAEVIAEAPTFKPPALVCSRREGLHPADQSPSPAGAR